ncbi:MAG: ABC transporter ATP-binding protein [Solirubrobacteraceae bacterium]
MSTIELRAVDKSFGTTPVLRGIDLTAPASSVTAVVGASGSGKTTLLRLIAGFEQIDAGAIAIGGRVLDDGRRAVRAQYRGVGYVPQDGALFPHLTVTSNIGFGLPRRERAAAAERLLELVGLADLGRRYPHQLSGGQQQRVALARALAIRPSIVLLDEPFSSLDAQLKVELRRDVAEILKETRSTTVLVSHDKDDVLALADQIIVLEDGRVSDPPGRSVGDQSLAREFLLGFGERDVVGRQDQV